MKTYLKRPEISLGIILLLAAILFFPGFSLYFHQDDFIHMTYSDTFTKLIKAFNIFAPGDFPFYRPIPTQVYFYTLRQLFGLNPLGYHIVNFILLSINTILVFKLVTFLSSSKYFNNLNHWSLKDQTISIQRSNKTVGVFAALFFAINATHIASIYAPAYCHELFYVLFGTSTIYAFVKKRKILSFAFFILALMSKENAVVLPGVIAITHIYQTRDWHLGRLFKVIFPYAVILTIYLIAHVSLYGLAKGPSYEVIIGKPTINILVWYFLWGLSVPNILIDFFGPGLKISPVFFQVAGDHGPLFIVSFFPSIAILFILGIRFHRVSQRPIIFGITWFILAMVPLLIFPLHKLATEQAFSLVGLSFVLAVIISLALQGTALQRYIGYLGLLAYLLHAANTITMAPKTHWIAISARQAKLTTDYLKSTYPTLPGESILYFQNGEIKIPQYGSAKQIFQALGNGAAIGIIYNNPNIQSYFDDVKPLPDRVKNSTHLVTLDASKFLGY